MYEPILDEEEYEKEEKQKIEQRIERMNSEAREYLICLVDYI